MKPETGDIRRLDVSDRQAAQEICALQRAAYSVEAEIIGFWGIPPLRDTPETLALCGEEFYGAFLAGKLAGLLSFELDCGTLHICRLAVDPGCFRRGIAKRLLAFAQEQPGITRLTVCTGKQNMPAIGLYLWAGFCIVKDFTVPGGVVLTKFEKMI